MNCTVCGIPALLSLVLVASQANGAVIFEDDFESYATTTAMNVVWANGGTADISTSVGNPGHSMSHSGLAASFSGGNTHAVTLPGVTVPVAGTLSLSVDIYDDGIIPLFSINNKRTTIGMRSGSSNIVEMGMYNDPSAYAFRLINFASGNPNWVAFSGITDDSGGPLSNLPQQGWHRFNVIFTETQATFTLDLGSTGIINATETVPVTLNPVGFTQLRLGGPSDLSSASGGVFFDNVSLVAVPEPSTFALLLCSLLTLVGRCNDLAS